MNCEHNDFFATVNVGRIQRGEGGPVYRYSADVRIVCTQCGVPMRFIGLPAGVDLNGAAVSIDGTEARLAIAPKGEVITPMDDDAVSGFTVRRGDR